MSSAAATSFTCTPGKLLNFTAVALNRSPYFSILRGLAFATTHLQPVRPRCQLNRGKLGVAHQRVVRPHCMGVTFNDAEHHSCSCCLRAAEYGSATTPLRVIKKDMRSSPMRNGPSYTARTRDINSSLLGRGI